MVKTISAYKSPVRLVRHAGEPVSPFSPATLNRARKKILAEIALAGNEMELEGILYTRNEAGALLDGQTEE
ncbi:MAG TPA: hypothetical protein VHK91_16305, partial [Flavisolibacter sp.]|nr:hypothetical protein [Flavisolibacter sp.]